MGNFVNNSLHVLYDYTLVCQSIFYFFTLKPLGCLGPHNHITSGVPV